jgi:DNA polymerase-3 subunit epsilon
MRFTAIDVETANPDLASICQIGIATFSGSTLVDEWVSLIDPEDYFSGINVFIHGITPEMVEGKPTIPRVADELRTRLDGQIAVCHTHFDRVATTRAFQSYGLSPPECKWLDSARVARRVWAEFARAGYGLENVCSYLGYEFQHHDALEDAKAAAFVLNSALQETGTNVVDWLTRVRRPIGSHGSDKITRDGNPEGDFFGEVMVFTGALEIPRHEAADLAAKLGCCVAANVTGKTTMLVVGDQDISRLAGHKRSSKHRKAEELIEKGQAIRILKETDFLELVKVSAE